MTLNNVRITGHGVEAKVELNGDDISNAVSGLDLKMAVGELPLLKLGVLVMDLSNEIDGVTVEIPEETASLLVKLGWTPPEDS